MSLQDVVGSDQRWEFGPAQGGMDLSQAPESVGQGYVPILNGVDPRVLGAYRRLPGFHKISETNSNSRIVPSDVGATGTSVLVDYFQPIVVRYANKPHERRGFVVSANNRLIFKYYDTLTATWATRTLVTDLDGRFGTRTDFDVSAQGRFLYVSRSDYVINASAGLDGIAQTPSVYYWDESDEIAPMGQGTSGESSAFMGANKVVVLGNNGMGEVYICGGFGVLRWTGTQWDSIGAFSAGGSVITIVSDGEKGIYIGGGFSSVVQPDGTTLSCNNIVHWTGTHFEALGAGLTGGPSPLVYAITIDQNGHVWAGGTFIVGGTCNNIGRWDGAAWQTCGTGAIATGVANTVYDLKFSASDNKVYVAGTGSADGWMNSIAKTRRICRTNAAYNSFESIYTTAPDTAVSCLAVDATSVYAGGAFTGIDGVSGTKAIAKYSKGGAAWTAMGTKMTGAGVAGVFGIITNYRRSNGTTYVAAVGRWTTTGTPAGPGHSMAYFDGSDWVALGDGVLRDGAVCDVLGLAAYRDYRLIVVGYFNVTGTGLTKLADVALYRDTNNRESSAVVGAGLWNKDGSLKVAAVTNSSIEAAYFAAPASGTHYYGVFVRATNLSRGFVSPPSQVMSFPVTGSDETELRELTITMSSVLALSSRPSHIEVWRSLPSTSPVVLGPFYRESQFEIDAISQNISSGLLTVTAWSGVLPDDSLAGQDPFDPTYDLGGAHAAGPAVGTYKGLLLSLSGAQRPPGSETTGEAFFDMRWSPPWNRNTEQTTYSGFWRTRITADDSPRFVVVGEYLALVSRGAVVRVQRTGDYLIITDGPDGVGPCSIHACCPVGGDLWMVTNGGELVKMNMSSGSIEGVMAVRRWFSTRWWHKVRRGELGMAYDASSGCLYITSMRTADDDYPQESLVIDTRTGRMSLVTDVSWRFARGGIDPETGRPTFFVIDRRGLIVAPDWQDRGVWEGNPQWAEKFFMTLLGNDQRSHELVTVSALETDGSYTYAGLTYWPTDNGDPLLIDARAYAISTVPASEQASEDPHTRYRLLGIGVVTDQSENSLTINWDKLLQHGFTGDVSSVDTDIRIIVGPVPFQIVFPLLKDENAPCMADNIAVTDMTVYVGEVSTPAAMG